QCMADGLARRIGADEFVTLRGPAHFEQVEFVFLVDAEAGKAGVIDARRHVAEVTHLWRIRAVPGHRPQAARTVVAKNIFPAEFLRKLLAAINVAANDAIPRGTVF